MPKDYGKMPEPAKLGVELLSVDHRYQRSLESRRSQRLIERIVANFKWKRFGAVIVVPNGEGRYLIIDGQHRVEACRRLDIEIVPCFITEPMTLAEQAEAFVAQNRDRVNVTGFTVHYANLASGEGVAVSMAKVCAAAGVEIVRYPIPLQSLKPGQTLSVGSIRTAVVVHGETLTTLALQALSQAFSEPGAIRSHLISAVVELVAEKCDVRTIQAAMAKATFAGLDRRIQDRALDHKESRAKAAVAIIRELIGAKKLLKTVPPAPAAKSRTSKPAATPAVKTPGRARLRADPMAETRPGARLNSESEIDHHIRTKGVTKCPPAAVAPTQASVVSRFDHEVIDERARQSQAAINNAARRRGNRAAVIKGKK